MSDTATVAVPSEVERVEAWRIEQALRLGYAIETAVWIGARQIDVHELARLIGQGCSRLTAVRILAP